MTRNALKQLNVAFALMSVIPLLICCYLITVRFFSIEILVGLNGVYFFFAIIIALLGLAIGRTMIRRVVEQLTHANAETEKLLVELGSANDQLQLELLHREEAEDAWKREKNELEHVNEVMMGREERVLELKQEVNELMSELNKPKKYA
jgi:biopolymer transport protein ExbB/TolQ